MVIGRGTWVHGYHCPVVTQGVDGTIVWGGTGGALGVVLPLCWRPRVAAGVPRSTVVFASPHPLMTFTCIGFLPGGNFAANSKT